jgi:hypothetical protein
MMSYDRYEGFTNYVTWLVCNLLLNDSDYYDAVKQLNSSCSDLELLAEGLERFVLDLVPCLDGIAGDLLSVAVAMVDWHDIADYLKNNYTW